MTDKKNDFEMVGVFDNPPAFEGVKARPDPLQARLVRQSEQEENARRREAAEGKKEQESPAPEQSPPQQSSGGLLSALQPEGVTPVSASTKIGGQKGPMDKGFDGPRGPQQPEGVEKVSASTKIEGKKGPLDRVSAEPEPGPDTSEAGEKQTFTLAEVRAEVKAAITDLMQKFYSREEVDAMFTEYVPPEIQGMTQIGNDPSASVGGGEGPSFLQLPPTPNLAGTATALWGPGPESSGEGLDWSKAMFGYEINPNGNDPLTVRIMAGRIGDITVGVKDVQLPSTPGTYYVWVRRTKSNDAVVIQSGASWPDDSGTYAYYVLHRFTVADGAASIHTVIRPLLRDRLHVDGTGLQYQVVQVDSEGALVIDWLRVGP